MTHTLRSFTHILGTTKCHFNEGFSNCSIRVWKYLPPACKLNKAALWMSHYYKWGVSGCSAIRKLLLFCLRLAPSPLLLWRCILCFRLFFFFLVFWKFKSVACWYAEALESHRICDCEMEWRLSIYEWPLTAGERWTAGFSLHLFLCLLSSSLFPPFCLSAPNAS